MNEDKTSTNDELETNQSEHENDDTTESEGEATEGRTYTEAELNERLEAERKERDKRWRERLKKAGGEESEGSKEKSGSQAVVSNDVVLARLEARGVLDTDIQNYLLSEAERLKKNPVELLSDSYYSTKIEEKKREKEQEAARPAPSSRTGTTDRSGDLNYHLQRAKDGKGLPSDPAMRRKVVAKLAGR